MEDDFDETGKRKRRKDTRFSKGTSGNKAGRPKGSRATTAIERVTRMGVEIVIDGKRRKVPAEEAAVMSLMKKALDGDIPAIRELQRQKDENAKARNAQKALPRQHGRRIVILRSSDSLLFALDIAFHADNDELKIRSWVIEAAMERKEFVPLDPKNLRTLDQFRERATDELPMKKAA